MTGIDPTTRSPTGVTGRDVDVISKAVSIAADVWRHEEPPPEVDSDLLIACILYTAIRKQQGSVDDRQDSTDVENMRAILKVGYPEYARRMAAL